MKEYHKTFIVPLYDRKFTIGICDQETIYELAKLLGSNDEEYKTWWGGMIPRRNSKYGWLLLFGNCMTPGDVAHESLHLMNRVMDQIYDAPDRENDEPDAYLLGWIVDKYYECRINYDKMKK